MSEERLSRVVRLRQDVVDRLREVAEAEGLSENEVIQRAILFYATHRGQELIPLRECMERLREKDRLIERLIRIQTSKKRRKPQKRS